MSESSCSSSCESGDEAPVLHDTEHLRIMTDTGGSIKVQLHGIRMDQLTCDQPVKLQKCNASPVSKFQTTRNDICADFLQQTEVGIPREPSNKLNSSQINSANEPQNTSLLITETSIDSNIHVIENSVEVAGDQSDAVAAVKVMSHSSQNERTNSLERASFTEDINTINSVDQTAGAATRLPQLSPNNLHDRASFEQQLLVFAPENRSTEVDKTIPEAAPCHKPSGAPKDTGAAMKCRRSKLVMAPKFKSTISESRPRSSNGVPVPAETTMEEPPVNVVPVTNMSTVINLENRVCIEPVVTDTENISVNSLKENLARQESPAYQQTTSNESQSLYQSSNTAVAAHCHVSNTSQELLLNKDVLAKQTPLPNNAIILSRSDLSLIDIVHQDAAQTTSQLGHQQSHYNNNTCNSSESPVQIVTSHQTDGAYQTQTHNDCPSLIYAKAENTLPLADSHVFSRQNYSDILHAKNISSTSGNIDSLFKYPKEAVSLPSNERVTGSHCPSPSSSYLRHDNSRITEGYPLSPLSIANNCPPRPTDLFYDNTNSTIDAEVCDASECTIIDTNSIDEQVFPFSIKKEPFGRVFGNDVEGKVLKRNVSSVRPGCAKHVAPATPRCITTCSADQMRGPCQDIKVFNRPEHLQEREIRLHSNRSQQSVTISSNLLTDRKNEFNRLEPVQYCSPVDRDRRESISSQRNNTEVTIASNNLNACSPLQVVPAYGSSLTAYNQSFNGSFKCSVKSTAPTNSQAINDITARPLNFDDNSEPPRSGEQRNTSILSFDTSPKLCTIVKVKSELIPQENPLPELGTRFSPAPPPTGQSTRCQSVSVVPIGNSFSASGRSATNVLRQIPSLSSNMQQVCSNASNSEMPQVTIHHGATLANRSNCASLPPLSLHHRASPPAFLVQQRTTSSPLVQTMQPQRIPTAPLNVMQSVQRNSSPSLQMLTSQQRPSPCPSVHLMPDWTGVGTSNDIKKHCPPPPPPPSDKVVADAVETHYFQMSGIVRDPITGRRVVQVPRTITAANSATYINFPVPDNLPPNVSRLIVQKTPVHQGRKRAWTYNVYVDST